MRLDLDKFREILTFIEDRPASATSVVWSKNPDLEPGSEGLEEAYKHLEHTKLLIEEGLIEGVVYDDHRAKVERVIVRELTMAGHDFLANIRNDTVWNQVKSAAVTFGGSLSLQACTALAESYAKKLLGLE